MPFPILPALNPLRSLVTGVVCGVRVEAVEDPLLQALGHDPVTIDALGARTGWPAAELAVRLLELELEGRVARLPGGLYQQRQGA